MNKEQFTKEFIAAVREMGKQKHPIGTRYWILTKEKERHWAIVLGWADGFDYSIQDKFKRKSYRLCAKFAYQSSNSMMQCDYDIDWLIPYNKDSGDVDDTEVGIYSGDDLNKTADWLWECYLSYFEDEIYECKKNALTMDMVPYLKEIGIVIVS